jgi:hypothetical protein
MADNPTTNEDALDEATTPCLDLDKETADDAEALRFAMERAKFREGGTGEI